MNTAILKVAFRVQKIYIAQDYLKANDKKEITQETFVLVQKVNSLGFQFSESLLHAVNQLSTVRQNDILRFLKEMSGVGKNWMPLVRQWNIPTGETSADHILTAVANLFGKGKIKGTMLACGHLIPDGTFPLERYNGCPFCGTPFETETLKNYKVHESKILDLCTTADLQEQLEQLLASPVALDATQQESIKILLKHLGLSKQVKVAMKETLIMVADYLIAEGNWMQASKLFQTPKDILRYLWYQHTGFLQLVQPKVISERVAKNNLHLHPLFDESSKVKINSTKALKLKFSRKECRMYASWLDALPLSIETICENMHPQREMWVRVIRALRLGEYGKKKGFERLGALMRMFYKEDYTVWEAQLQAYRTTKDAGKSMALLKQRPGFFARSLFANMLYFDPDYTLQEFKKVMHQVPKRLIYSLGMYAEYYFDPNQMRNIKPLGGVSVKVAPNQYLKKYSTQQLAKMQKAVSALTLDALQDHFSAQKSEETKNMYIAEELYHIPLPIGDRSEQVQDQAVVPQGARFKVKGSTVRLFMQWGEGLPAQHMDMDLSALVIYPNKTERCSYSSLTIKGCKHSGDIRHIPDRVGTAEYIDIDVTALKKAGARYVKFTCNAYSNGSLSPNLLVGWMNSRYPMKISKTGVAYNPTAVQQQCRITKGLTKGLVFGVLDVQKAEIIWLEMPFQGQVVQALNVETVEALLKKLDSKISIGQALRIKAKAQGLKVVASLKADEVYDLNWAMDISGVAKLLL